MKLAFIAFTETEGIVAGKGVIEGGRKSRGCGDDTNLLVAIYVHVKMRKKHCC